MRVVDLDRDMSDVFPTGATIDSEFLFQRMQEAALAALRAGPGSRVADVACGVGQDDRALAARGVRVTGAEPSQRMLGLALLEDARAQAELVRPARVRAWSEALPFPDGVFDGVFCKGSLDHFDDPLASLREMARVARPRGRVVVAVANFESLACRAASRQRSGLARGRLHFDVPSDHFTRYDPALLREQLEQVIEIEDWIGVSLLWGLRGWSRLLQRLPPPAARGLLGLADALARRMPAWADVIVAAGPPRAPVATARAAQAARNSAA